MQLLWFYSLSEAVTERHSNSLATLERVRYTLTTHQRILIAFVPAIAHSITNPLRIRCLQIRQTIAHLRFVA